MRRLAFASVLATVLTGCAAVPELGAAPEPKAAASLPAAQTFQAPARDWPAERWWAAYGDPQLDRLVEEAVAGSPTLDQAQARFRRAQAQLDQARAVRSPQVNANAQVAEVKQSYNNGIPALFVPKGWNDTARATLDLSWDADLFGRNRAALASAASEAEAARLDAEQARLMLTSSVVATYAELARLYAERGSAEDGLRLRQLTVRLATQRVQEGVVNAGEQRQAEAAEAASRQEMAALDEQILLAKQRLASLTGTGPDRALAITAPAKSVVQVFGLPANLTVDLVGRRPDLQAARQRAEAAASRIKVARAGFYPNVNLAAFIGLQSLHIDNLVRDGSDIGQVAGALNLPIFSGGRLEGAYRGARADYDLAVANYDQTLVQALQEVADAAASERALELQIVEARNGLAAAEESARIARLRYEGGLSNVLSALVAEDAAINQRRLVANLEARRLSLDAALARALGGGFRGS